MRGRGSDSPFTLNFALPAPVADPGFELKGEIETAGNNRSLRHWRNCRLVCHASTGAAGHIYAKLSHPRSLKIGMLRQVSVVQKTQGALELLIKKTSGRYPGKQFWYDRMELLTRDFIVRPDQEAEPTGNDDDLNNGKLHGPYYKTIINAPPTKDRTNHYWITFSCGAHLDPNLKQAILDALPTGKAQSSG